MKNTILGLGSNLKFYYYQHPVNMGKGIESLKGLVINEFGMSPDEKSVFVFISKNHKEIKPHIYLIYTKDIWGKVHLPMLQSGRRHLPVGLGHTEETGQRLPLHMVQHIAGISLPGLCKRLISLLHNFFICMGTVTI